MGRNFATLGSLDMVDADADIYIIASTRICYVVCDQDSITNTSIFKIQKFLTA